ncbi:hypothetical protein RHSIM_Rhsim13G0229300 [Rhododendron simsii]|uniref:Beta-glucosidase n=1 Tax=Rhododendron simsii TaxID=118357 RepID=A0A834G7M1_RHOSS|nr:hypothetical protein RHSIM_Rhsim13G0229300 [Rhododendron simsii]
MSSSKQLHSFAFGDDFVWGTAASAYQVGFVTEAMEQRLLIFIIDIRFLMYETLQEDVQIMKNMGFNAFRFSISWSRILPSGKISGGVNREGIQFYHDLIDELLLNGIRPFVTLFHWDLPQALESEYMGFLSTQIVGDFCDYANLCFWEYGGKVKNWITLNEPVSYCCGGYVDGGLAPGRGSDSSIPLNSPAEGRDSDSSIPLNSLAEGHETFTGIRLPRSQATEPAGNRRSSGDGDPGTEPYIVARNQLLAHAAAVKLYKDNFQDFQKGQIGIVLVSNWFLPWDANSEVDRAAAKRALDFMLGWFMDPLIKGVYPENMIKYVDKDRLPSLRVPDCPEIQGKYDFIGINYYTAQYVLNSPKPPGPKKSYKTDQQLMTTYYNKKGVPIGEKSGADWLYIYPKGIEGLLKWIAETYGEKKISGRDNCCVKDLVIYITENGVAEKDDCQKTIKEALVNRDASGGDMRTDYHRDHLQVLNDAMTDITKKYCVKIKGYFAWSLVDNYEWAGGYKTRFGLMYVDYKDGHLARYPKESATWFAKFLKGDGQS